MTEAEICDLIRSDEARMRILQAVANLQLTDWWIGAGFLRNAVWDHLFGQGIQTSLNDVDVVYWKSLDQYNRDVAELESLLITDAPNPIWEEEQTFAACLAEQLPEQTFEVKNQARMHLWTAKDAKRRPYSSAAEGIADWVETATTVGARLDNNGEVVVFAAHGISDLVNGVIRPTKPELEARTLERATEKRWLHLWPTLHFEEAI